MYVPNFEGLAQWLNGGNVSFYSAAGEARLGVNPSSSFCATLPSNDYIIVILGVHGRIVYMNWRCDVSS